jgi:hypothetical protein
MTPNPAAEMQTLGRRWGNTFLEAHSFQEGLVWPGLVAGSNDT